MKRTFEFLVAQYRSGGFCGFGSLKSDFYLQTFYGKYLIQIQYSLLILRCYQITIFPYKLNQFLYLGEIIIMRSRSGALHCETEEELLELAQTTHVGMYYNDQLLPEEVGFKIIEGFREIKNFQNCQNQVIQYIQEENFLIQEQKQLNRGKRYLNCCFVDKEYIKCSIQITILTRKVDQKINKILQQQSLDILFCHKKEESQNCLFSHYCVQSQKNSNVVDVFTFDKETVKNQSKKTKGKLAKMDWIKQSKQEKAMELIIVNKHISIKSTNEIEHKNIILNYKIWVINPKFLESHSLLQVYLKKSHFVIQVDEKSGRFYQSRFEKDCKLFDKKRCQIQSKQNDSQFQEIKFKNVFHNIQAKIAKKYLKNLKQIIILENKKQKEMESQHEFESLSRQKNKVNL